MQSISLVYSMVRDISLKQVFSGPPCFHKGILEVPIDRAVWVVDMDFYRAWYLVEPMNYFCQYCLKAIIGCGRYYTGSSSANKETWIYK
jgi:hypothetical protein